MQISDTSVKNLLLRKDAALKNTPEKLLSVTSTKNTSLLYPQIKSHPHMLQKSIPKH